MSRTEKLNKIVDQLCNENPVTKQVLFEPTEMPSIDEISQIVELSKQVFFPGCFDNASSQAGMRFYRLGVCVDELYGKLKNQVFLCFKTFAGKDINEDEADEIVVSFLDSMPEIKRQLYTDVDAMFHTDPAVTAFAEIIYCYPFIQAMIHYRVAHRLLELGIPVLPRIITEMAHSKTGIDIHPGAKIGDYFCIDHGTGVVIGGTCIIGMHVTLYQGVTLGAKHFTYDENGTPQDVPRHPIIEDNVTIYSNATILGRITIGHDTTIGGNIWVTESVAPNSKIVQRKAIATQFTDGAGI